MTSVVCEAGGRHQEVCFLYGYPGLPTRLGCGSAAGRQGRTEERCLYVPSKQRLCSGGLPRVLMGTICLLRYKFKFTLTRTITL